MGKLFEFFGSRDAFRKDLDHDLPYVYINCTSCMCENNVEICARVDNMGTCLEPYFGYTNYK